MSEGLQLLIESCHDCPRFRARAVRHWMLDPGQVAYEYICTKAHRYIVPREGTKPPPEWCPLRAALAPKESPTA